MSAPELFVVQFPEVQKIYSYADEGFGRNNAAGPDEHGEIERLMEDMVRETLQSLNVSDAMWTGGQATAQAHHPVTPGKGPAPVLPPPGKIQVMFPSRGGRRTEIILQHLEALGLGEPNTNTSIWILPMIIQQPEQKLDSQKEELIQSRLTVQQVVSSITSSAQLSMDYLLLTFSASVIAGFGLGGNDNVATVASMLVSPLMGPILAVTFGTVIRDRELWTMGLKNELIGLAICFVTGFLGGLVFGSFGEDFNWPSDFMLNRGRYSNLAISLGIAVPSGIGVALSVLGNNTGSLIGVAISASLLPPAVNWGLMWGYAIVAAAQDQSIRSGTDDAGANVYDGTPGFLIETGAVSLLLTIVNISVIYFMGLLFCYLKSVAPDATGVTRFWKHDIAAFRHEQHTTIRKDNSQSIQKELSQYLASQREVQSMGLGFASDSAPLARAASKFLAGGETRSPQDPSPTSVAIPSIIEDEEPPEEYTRTLNEARNRQTVTPSNVGQLLAFGPLNKKKDAPVTNEMRRRLAAGVDGRNYRTIPPQRKTNYPTLDRRMFDRSPDKRQSSHSASSLTASASSTV